MILGSSYQSRLDTTVHRGDCAHNKPSIDARAVLCEEATITATISSDARKKCLSMRVNPIEPFCLGQHIIHGLSLSGPNVRTITVSKGSALRMARCALPS